MFNLVMQFFLWVFYTYLAVSVFYLLVFAIAGKFFKTKKHKAVADKRKIAVLIPSYKEDNIIVETAHEASCHNYPSNKFNVVVIADKLQPETVSELKSIANVKVVEVAFEISTKAKSLHQALTAIRGEGFDIAMILDADNVMSDGCLESVNAAFNEGFKVVQCHRTAKNDNTPVALLDGISEEINNNIFRSGQRFFGFSSAVIGSGLAFEFSLLDEIFSSTEIQNNPGEDRVIDVELLSKKITIEYLKGVYVYDEKVSNAQVFQKQRVRWIEAQINHIKLLADKELSSLRFTLAFLNKFFQCFLLPRLLFIATFSIIGFILVCNHFFLHININPSAKYWWILIMVYFFALIVSLPARYFSFKTAKALTKIPVLIVSMIKSILQMKIGRKEFLHTPKSFTKP